MNKMLGRISVQENKVTEVSTLFRQSFIDNNTLRLVSCKKENGCSIMLETTFE